MKEIQLTLDKYNKLETKGDFYKQNWKAYDLAKTNEDIIFKNLLLELLKTYSSIIVEEKKVGRTGYDFIAKIFLMCIKTYYKCDLRKCVSIAKELKRLGYIHKVPCYKTINNFFRDPIFNQLLDELIYITALPLACLEETGAIDSTGISMSQYERWFNHKWGKKEGKEQIWRKLHAIVGCKTNVFINVEVTKKNKGDVTMIQELVNINKLRTMKIDKFVGDKAYNSRNVYEFLSKLQLEPLIPFRSNTSGKARGSMVWAKIFKHFKENQEEFYKKYYLRNNIETSFHMLKQRFGSNVKTKSFEANVNEIKIKCLCHNLCVLIQEVCESNIEVNFESCVKISCSV